MAVLVATHMVVCVDAKFCLGYCAYFILGASAPFVARFEFGPRTLSFSFCLFIYRVFEVLLY